MQDAKSRDATNPNRDMAVHLKTIAQQSHSNKLGRINMEIIMGYVETYLNNGVSC